MKLVIMQHYYNKKTIKRRDFIMKFGSMKKKLIVGVAAFGLVSGAGVAFAASDAGGELQSWYNAKFNTAKTDSRNAVIGYAVGQAGALTNEFNGLKNGAKADIAAAGTTEQGRASGEINTYKQSYIDAINTKETEIGAGMAAAFDSHVTSTTNEMNAIINGVAAAYKTQATNEINTQGTTSFNAVTTNVGLSKTEALAALTKEIADTKAALQALLNAEVTTASQELKNNFDTKVQAKRVELTNYINGLETAKILLIQGEGSRIEGEAKSEMDTLVDGIN
jgi:hypothetical protein